MSLAPFVFTAFIQDTRIITLQSPVTFYPQWDGEFFFVENEDQLGMHIRADGESLEELSDRLVEGIFANWDTYALVDPISLKNGQRSYRAELLARMKEPANQLWWTFSTVEVDSAEVGNWATDSINTHEQLRSSVDGIIRLYGIHDLSEDEVIEA